MKHFVDFGQQTEDGHSRTKDRIESKIFFFQAKSHQLHPRISNGTHSDEKTV